MIASTVIAQAALPAATIRRPEAPDQAIDKTLRGEREECVPLLEALVADRLLDDPRRGGAGERGGDAEDGLQQADVPYVRCRRRAGRPSAACAVPLSEIAADRGSRGAAAGRSKTPPRRRKITIGISRASSTIPRAVAPPKSRTAKASATVAMPEPSVDTVTDAR